MNTLIKAILLGGGAYLLYRTGILSSITGGLIPTPSSGSMSGSSASPAANSGGPPAFNSLAATGARVNQAAILDYQKGDRANQLSVANDGTPSTTFSAWNYFLTQQTSFSDLPAYSDVTGQPDPQVPMTFGQYWQLISPWLTKTHGLTGLGEVPFVPADYVGSGAMGMGQLLGLAGAASMAAARGRAPFWRRPMSGFVNSVYPVPRNAFWPDPRRWSL